MQFSADAFAKHSSGIQPFFCRDQESDCRNNDKGIQNKHGVWFIPNQAVNEPGNMMPCIFNESFFRKSQNFTDKSFLLRFSGTSSATVAVILVLIGARRA
jgi:hypothetical protein